MKLQRSAKKSNTDTTQNSIKPKVTEPILSKTIKHGLFKISSATTCSQFISLPPGTNLALSLSTDSHSLPHALTFASRSTHSTATRFMLLPSLFFTGDSSKTAEGQLSTQTEDGLNRKSGVKLLKSVGVRLIGKNVTFYPAGT